MKQAKLGRFDASVNMRLADALIQTVLDCGINADIYGKGRSEELFGQALSNEPVLRERIVLQSK